MKLRFALTLASLAALSGCGMQPQSQYWTAGQVNTAPPGRAMAWLPAQAGPVVSVVEERRANGLVQDIVLAGEDSQYGENKISITAVTGSDFQRKWLIPNQASISPVTETDVAQEIEEVFPNMKMGVGDTLERNAYGPFGYAVGKSGKVGCMYAWQTIGREERMKLFPDGLSSTNMPAAIRVKLCRAGANPMAMVTLMRQLTIGGAGYGGAPTSMAMAGGPAYGAGGYGNGDALSAAGLGSYNPGYNPGAYAANTYGAAGLAPAYPNYGPLTQGMVAYNTMQPGLYNTPAAADDKPLYKPKAKARPVVRMAHRPRRPRYAAQPAYAPPSQPSIAIPLPDSAYNAPAPQTSKAIYLPPSSSSIPLPQ